MAERDIILDLTDEELEQLEASPFINIPPKGSKPAEGDDCWILVEAQANISEKTPGVSYQVPLMVVEDGENKGKLVDWYLGIQSKALGITMRALDKFGVKDQVMPKIKGKTHFIIDRIAGAQAKARFVRQWSNPQEAGKQPILRAVLDSTQFLASDESPPVPESLV